VTSDCRLDKATATVEQLLAATFVTMEFSVRGESIGLGRSGDPHFCPVSATARRIIHLQQAQAPLTQPLASYLNPQTDRLRRIAPSDITHLLRKAVHILGTQYVFLPKDISARSLRASGAMALLCANVDTDRIRLIGAVGDLTRCSDISTSSKPSPLCGTFLPACSLAVTSHSSRTMKSPCSNMPPRFAPTR
jgi:hypothetical protein